MATRLALHRLDRDMAFTVKMRDFMVKHKTTLQIKIYDEQTPGREVIGPCEGKLVSSTP